MSPSVTGTPAAAVVMLYQSLRTVNTCGIAAAAMFVYDYILCTGREYQYVWQSRNSRASRLVYLYISCLVLGWCTTALALLNLIGPAILTTLRTYVLSGRNKLLGGSALILSLGPFLVNVSSQYRYLPVNLPPPENCGVAYTGSAAENIGLTAAARSCAILADCITIVVTWQATRTSRNVLRDSFLRPSLQDIMWTNGNIYFITLLFGNLLDLILITLSITDTDNGENQVTQFLDAINSILSSRFLLDLYETNARLERGGSSLSQSNIGTHSLCFTESGGARADAPESPPLLDSFSGPVLQSFPDDDRVFDTIENKPGARSSLSIHTAATGPTVEKEGPSGH